MVIRNQKDLSEVQRKIWVSIEEPYSLCPDKGETLDACVRNGSLYNKEMDILYAMYLPANYRGSVVIPHTVNEIRGGAFIGKTMDVLDTNNVSYISANGFHGSTLDTFKGRENLLDMCSNSFSSCQIRLIDLSQTSITTLCKNTFYLCKINQIFLPKTLRQIDREVFTACNLLKTIDILDVLNITAGAFAGCQDLQSILINGQENGENTNFIVKNRILYTKDGKLLCVPSDWSKRGKHIKKSLSFTVDDVQGIEGYAMASNQFNQIHICEGVKYIGMCAFKCNHKLTEISLPDSLESIGKRAFDGCKKLKVITLPKNVREVGAAAFTSCSSLNEIVIMGDTHFDGNPVPYCHNFCAVTIGCQLSKDNEKNVLHFCNSSEYTVKIKIPKDYIIKNPRMFKKRIESKQIFVERY